MSAAAGLTTFPCPHCGATYPLKPVLIGKLVRCKSCSKAFRLNADGVAEKVAEATPVPGSTPTPVPASPPPAVPTPIPVSEPTPVPAAAKPATPAPGRPPEKRNSERIQLAKQQEGLRKQMAANLAESMGKALETEAVKAEEKKIKSERIAKAGGKPGDDGKKKRSGRAILTGEGEREAENDRRWWLAGIGLILVIAAIAWLATWENERARALEAFTAEVPASQNRYGVRAQTLVARAWITQPAADRPAVQPVVDIASPRLGSVVTIPPSALGPLVRLKGLTLHRDLGVWCADTQVEAIRRKTALGLTPAAVVKELAKSGLDDGSVRVLDQLLHGVPAPDAKPILAALAGGEAPAIRWCEFHGPTATALLDIGGSYRTRTGAYTGTLVSIGGSPWRVVDLVVNSQPGKP